MPFQTILMENQMAVNTSIIGPTKIELFTLKERIHQCTSLFKICNLRCIWHNIYNKGMKIQL